MYSPFLRPTSPHYADMLTDAAVCVLEDRGLPGLSVAALARWMHVTPESIHNEYSRARVIELIVIHFGRRWLQWARYDHPNRLPARLPQTADEVHGVRVQVALAELARGEDVAGRPAPAQCMAGFRRDELATLRRELRHAGGQDPSGPALEATAALVTGLRLALAETEPTLTWDMASEILRAHVGSGQNHEDGVTRPDPPSAPPPLHRPGPRS